jgi:hypothetical protein
MERLHRDYGVGMGLTEGHPHEEDVRRLLEATHQKAVELGYSRDKVHEQIAAYHVEQAMGGMLMRGRRAEIARARGEVQAR